MSEKHEIYASTHLNENRGLNLMLALYCHYAEVTIKPTRPLRTRQVT